MQHPRVFRALAGHVSGLAVSLALTAAAACDLLGPDEERFIISVDSVSAPSMIAPNQALAIRFFGGIGPDGCSRLERVGKHLISSSLEITFRGIRAKDVQCTQMPVELDYTETVLLPIQNPFTIYVIQSRGPAVQRTVTVGG